MASSLPSLLKPQPEPRFAKYITYGIIVVVVGLITYAALWLFVFRFKAEENTTAKFMNQVILGQYDQAYKMWKAGASYSYNDFLQDWGPQGYYGPVRSFRIVDAGEMKGASGAIITVDVSPAQPFPSPNDPEQDSKIKQVRLWVQFHDQSISYAPPI